MKRFFCYFTVLFFILSSSVAFGLNCNKIKKDELLSQLPNNPFIKAFFSRAKILNKRKVKGLCEVVLDLNGRFYPCYVGKDFLLMGQMYSNGQLVSKPVIERLKAKKEQKDKKLFLSKKSELDKLAAIVYTPSKKAKRVLYMFTDPLCPFCHKMESKIKEIVDKYNVTLKVMLYSVHPPKGPKKAIEAVCKKFTLDKYLSENWRKEKDEEVNKYQCKQGKQLIEKTSKIARELGVRGVPTFIMDDGTRVVGARINELEKLLKKETTK